MASFDPAIPQAQPNQNVAAKSLDDRQTFPRHAFSRLLPVLRMGVERAFAQPIQYLADQRKALFDLAHTDPDARIDVTLIQDRYVKKQTVIRRIGEGPARVEGSAGGAADETSGGILFGQGGFEHAGIDGPVLQRRGVVV